MASGTQVGSIYYDLDLDDKKFVSGINSVKNELKGLEGAFRSAEQGSKIFLGALTAIGIAGLGAITAGVKYAGELETLEIALQTVSGSSEKAAEAMDIIRKKAAESPFFDTSSLAQFTQVMTASGQSIEKAVQSAIGFGDVAASFGKGTGEMTRMGNTLSQVIGKGKADIVDFKELVNAGWVSVRKDVAETMDVSMAQFEEMVSAGEIGYEQIAKAAEKYAGNADRQANTFQALMNRTKESILNLFSGLVIDTGIFDGVKNALIEFNKVLENVGSKENITKFMEFMKDWGPVVAGIILGGITPALFAMAGGFIAVMAPLIPFMIAGGAIALILKLLNDRFDLLGKGLPILAGILGGIGAIIAVTVVPAFIGWAIAAGSAAIATIAATWPLLLLAIAVGLVIAAIVWLVMNWEQVWNTIVTVAQNVWNTLVQFFTVSVPAFVETVITFLKELPTKILDFVWNVIILGFVEFLGLLVGLAVYGIPNLINTIINFLVNLPGMVWNILVSVYNFFVQAWNNIWNWLKTNIPIMISNVVAFIQQLPGKVWTIMVELKGKAEKGIKDAWTALLDEVKQWPQRMFDWGKKVIQSFADGIKNAIGAIADAFKEGMNRAKSLVEGKSPPIEGPFKEIDKWGFNVGMAWVDGFNQAFSTLSLPSTLPVINGIGGGGANGVSTNQDIDIYIDKVGDQQDVSAIGRELGFRAGIMPR